jgi:hypothetical protein
MERESTAPQTFEEMEPGTVFSFQPGLGPLVYFVWDGREGHQVHEHEAVGLANQTADNALRFVMTRSSGGVRPFGASTNNAINKDFNRVTILSQ